MREIEKKTKARLKAEIRRHLEHVPGLDELDLASLCHVSLRDACAVIAELQKEGKIKPMRKNMNAPLKKFGRCLLCRKPKKRTRFQICYSCRAKMKMRRHAEGIGR